MGNEKSLPLKGIRVVELGRTIPTASCGRQFALYGADVITLELSNGSPLRQSEPLVSDSAGNKISLLWGYLSANKRVMTLDDGEEGNDLGDVLALADVLITDFNVESIKALTNSYSDIIEKNSNLCVVSVTPFGLNGPYSEFKSSELVVQALSGYLKLNGKFDEAPLQAPGHLISAAVGVSAFTSALAGVVKKLQGRGGSFVEVSEMETICSLLPLLTVEYSGKSMVRQGGSSSATRLFPTSDGWVSLALMQTADDRKILCEFFEIPIADWLMDLNANSDRETVDEAVKLFSEYTKRKTSEDVFHGLLDLGVVCGKVMCPKDILSDPHLIERGLFREVLLDQHHTIKVPGAPAKFSTLDVKIPFSTDIKSSKFELKSVNWVDKEEENSQDSVTYTATDEESLPLEGIRIVDLTQAWIGPYASLLMSDLGAEIIKVESHKRPDVWRQPSITPKAVSNFKPEVINQSPFFNSVNRDKRNLAVDLKSQSGREIFFKVAATADIVMENFTPNVMSNLGLDYQKLKEVNDSIVMTSFSGFGKTGPYSNYKSNGAAIESMSGWDSLHAHVSEDPMLMGFYQADPICGLQMAAVTLVALIHKIRTGEGQAIDGSMNDTAIGYISEQILHAGFEPGPVPQGNRDPDIAISGVFKCSGEDQWIAISIDSENAWNKFSTMEGLSDSLDSNLYKTLANRKTHQNEIEEIISNWTQSNEAQSLMLELQSAGVSAGVVRSLGEIKTDPHLKYRQWFKPLEHPNLGLHQYNGSPFKIQSVRKTTNISPPRLGENTDDILSELGFASEDINALRKQSVVGSIL